MSVQAAVIALRGLHPGKDDEALKRVLLAQDGWLFSRRTGFWEKGGYQLDPAHTLSAVMHFVSEGEAP